jgi:DNA helicase HerA-like ATPase
MDDAQDGLGFRQRLIGSRRTLQKEMEALALASSVDGRTFTYEAPLTSNLPLGGYVRLTADDGRIFLGQVLQRSLREREGPELNFGGNVFGSQGTEAGLTQTSFRMKLQSLEGSGVLIGESDGSRFTQMTRGTSFKDADIAPADSETVGRYLDDWASSRTTLPIGSIGGVEQVAARINAAGFDRHTFLVGQSGSGKTYSLGILLEQLILETDLRIVILDPNADYVQLAKVLESVKDDDLRARYEEAAKGVRVLRPMQSAGTVDEELHVRYSELSRAEQALSLKLDPIESREEFNTFWQIVDRLDKESYSLADVRQAAASDLSALARQLSLRIDNLDVAKWDVWAATEGRSLASTLEDNWRVLVLDLSGFGRQDEQSIVALATLGHFWKHRNEKKPVLIVADEAHNLFPQEATHALQQPVIEHAIRIAGEGRKYGLYMLVATQRPQKIHINVLSQCDNLVLMRVNSHADLGHLASVFSFVPESLLAESPVFAQGESLLAGKIVPSPMLMRFGRRISQEGGSDVPADWARRS